MNDSIERSAILSPCGTYRYHLSRILPEGKGVVTFVMLNPSTADGQRDDPTIRKCLGFAQRFGYGKIFIVNLFAFRSTNPRGLLAARDPIGPDADRHICQAMVDATRVVFAWGAINPRWLPRARAVVAMARGVPAPCHLGRTKGGQPRHPLMLAYTTPLEKYLTPTFHENDSE